MAKYSPITLQRSAGQLMRLSWVIVAGMILSWLVPFATAGYAMGMAMKSLVSRNPPRGWHLDPVAYPWLVGIVGAILGGWIGYVAGTYIVAMLRTFAQMGLCLAEMEERSRVVAPTRKVGN